MKIVISGYGRMGHMVEARLRARGIEPALCYEDIDGRHRTLGAVITRK